MRFMGFINEATNAGEDHLFDYIHPVRTQEEYDHAMEVIDLLFEKPDRRAFEDYILSVVIPLVNAYEDENYPITAPDAVSFLKQLLIDRGMKQADLAPFMGGPTRVSEFMNRKRRLTADMIENLSKGLKVPADLLLGDTRVQE